MTGNKEQGKPSCLCFAGFKVEQALCKWCWKLANYGHRGVAAGSQRRKILEQDQKKRS